MEKSELQKMQNGEWYTCLDQELDQMRQTAREAVFEHNQLEPGKRGPIAPKLKALLGCDHAFIEAPFHCAYGVFIELGRDVYLNAGCTILDTARVQIGDQSQLGPNVQIYCAHHHLDAAKRCDLGLEIAHPVRIGKRVWIGGGAIILPGITIGDDAVVGAGSVVTKDVASGAIVVGNPAKPVQR